MFKSGGAAAVFDIGNGMGTAGRTDQQAVALRIVAGVGGGRRHFDQPAVGLVGKPAEMPLEMILEVVFLPIWIILVPVSACWRLLVSATE